jgi:hypothetical protein
MENTRLENMKAWLKETQGLLEKMAVEIDEIGARESELPDGPERDELRARWGGNVA